MIYRRMLLTILTVITLGSTLCASTVSWEFNGTATPTGADVKMLGGKPAFVSTGMGQGLASGTSLNYADNENIRLAPEMEILCRFRLDKLQKGIQILATKDGEYLLRVHGTNEDRRLVFFVKIEGKWESRVSGPVVEAGKWYDVHVTWSGQELRMDVNGETFKRKRSGRIKPGSNPLRVGPIAGAIDRLEIRNPGVTRKSLLKKLASYSKLPLAEKDVAARSEPIIFGGKAGWTGWRAQSGAVADVQGGRVIATFPTATGMFLSPPLAYDLAQRSCVCFNFETTDPNWTGSLDFATEEGVDSLPFKVTPGGSLVVVNGSTSDAWTGTLRRLSLSFSGGKGPITVKRLALADRPIGEPSFYIRSLAPGRAKLRPGREETVVLGLMNVGGEAESISVRLLVPRSLKLLNEQQQTIPYLGMDDFDMVTWQVRAKRPGNYRVRVEVAAKGAETLAKDLILKVEPLPRLARTGYVPKPRPAKTDYINLMHYCALWKEGTHLGWEKIEPWPEKRPAIGWYDEGTPEVADWHIKYALEHGINGFIYCWYRAHYKPEIEHKLGHAIHDGLFNAKYRDMFNFTIMWENGCAKGVKDEADLLENVLPFWIKNYFTHPSYLKIENRPVLFVWQPRRLLQQLGGPEKTKQALEKMRAQCKKAGFDGLRLIACMDNPYDKKLGKQIAESGWDAVSGYNIATPKVKPVGLDPAGLAYRDHAEILSNYKEGWLARDENTGSTPQIPNIVMNRDDRPWGRIKRGRGSYGANPRAENFEVVCRQAKELIDAKPAGRWDSNIVVLDNWTEFGEGHYIEPTTGTGFTFVNAVKKVFCRAWAPEWMTDVIPEDIGMPSPQKRYEETRARFGDRKPWQPRRITGDLLAFYEFESEKDGCFLDSSANNNQLINKGASLVPDRGDKVLCCGQGAASTTVPTAFFSSGGVSAALWCKPSEAKQSDRWMLNTVGSSTSGYRLGLGGGHPVWQVPQKSWSHSLRAPKPLPVDQWSHVSATFDNRVMRLYVNGKEVASRERRGFINPGDKLTIGGFSTSMPRAHFQGDLDDVQIYRRVLTPVEIAEMAKK